VLYNLIFVFFFQAEDGIRDRNVTGVQTCALPISCAVFSEGSPDVQGRTQNGSPRSSPINGSHQMVPSFVAIEANEGPRKESKWRSEERRVGKECRSRWGREY